MDDSKLLFSAETADDEKICIKFVRHYSKDVRPFCASKGFALTSKGFEDLPGGWHMVVMEMIGEDYWISLLLIPTLTISSGNSLLFTKQTMFMETSTI